MAGIAFEAVRMALVDAVEKQQAITARLQGLPDQSELLELVDKQSGSLKKILSLFSRIIWSKLFIGRAGQIAMAYNCSTVAQGLLAHPQLKKFF